MLSASHFFALVRNAANSKFDALGARRPDRFMVDANELDAGAVFVRLNDKTEFRLELSEMIADTDAEALLAHFDLSDCNSAWNARAIDACACALVSAVINRRLDAMSNSAFHDAIEAQILEIIHG